MTQTCLLESRALLSLTGDEAISFLQNLVTCDVENLSEGDLAFGALLTPQGKVLFDFYLLKTANGFILDCPEQRRVDLQKRLMFYRLRAAVTIEPTNGRVYGSWDGNRDVHAGTSAVDPRHEGMGNRIYVDEEDTIETNAGEAEWHVHRMIFGIPHSDADFELGSAFPHEVLMDQIGGIAFTKGCYVGQEVVSRMQHRGTARRRVVKVEKVVDASFPAMGSEIMADGKAIGTMGGSSSNIGLAIVRLDRYAKARDAELPITCDGIEITVQLPDFVSFTLEG